YRMVQTQTVAHAKIKITNKTIFILEFVSHCSAGPTSRYVVTLVFEAGAVDFGDRVEWSVEQASGVVNRVHVRALMAILVAGEPMLPSRWTVNRKVHTSEQIVLPLPLI